jgi:hypothetical protein
MAGQRRKKTHLIALKSPFVKTKSGFCAYCLSGSANGKIPLMVCLAVQRIHPNMKIRNFFVLEVVNI